MNLTVSNPIASLPVKGCNLRGREPQRPISVYAQFLYPDPANPTAICAEPRVDFHVMGYHHRRSTRITSGGITVSSTWLLARPSQVRLGTNQSDGVMVLTAIDESCERGRFF